MELKKKKKKSRLKICASSCKKERGVQNVNVMLSIYLREMLREFVGKCVSAQSPLSSDVSRRLHQGDPGGGLAPP